MAWPRENQTTECLLFTGSDHIWMSCTHTAVSRLQLSHTHNARFLHNNCSHRVVLQLYSTVVIDRVTICLDVVNKPWSYDNCKTLWVLTLLLQHTLQTATLGACTNHPMLWRPCECKTRRHDKRNCGKIISWNSTYSSPSVIRRMWNCAQLDWGGTGWPPALLDRLSWGESHPVWPPSTTTTRWLYPPSLHPPSLYISIYTQLGCPVFSGW